MSLAVLLSTACQQPRELTDSERTSILAWLVCEECTAGERDSARVIGAPAVPFLAAVLDSVPAIIVDPMRTRLNNRWTPELGIARDAYVAAYMTNTESLARIRAARLLGDLDAETELREGLALGLARSYREDVIRAIEGALAAVIDPATAVTRVRVEPESLTVAVGGTTQPAVFVEDSASNLMAPANVVWLSSNATVASVSTTGVIAGLAPGTATITATVSGRSASTTVNVTENAPTTYILQISAGDHQSAGAGEYVSDSLSVTLQNTNGTPVSGATVHWGVLLGNGTIQPEVSSTGSNGSASTRWLLGVAGPQRVEARVTGAPAVVFRANANE
jgi:hypothetical protein